FSDSTITSLPFLLVTGVTTLAVANTGLAVGISSLLVGTDPSARVLAVGMDPLPMGTSTTLLAKTVAASIEVNIVAISSVSSLTIYVAASPSSILLPLIVASSPELVAATPSLSSNCLTLSFNRLIFTS
nr:hypothetical protein [Tanacetum cinerariifolium]